MSSTAAQKAGETVLAPRGTGKQKVQSCSTGTSSAAQALWTGLSTDAPTGLVYVSFAATTADAYVMFSTSNGDTVTTSTGWPIGAGSKEPGFWIDASVITHVTHITASGSGRLYWYVSSPETAKATGVI